MTKREQELSKRIEELEKKVKDLEARPVTKQEFHYHYAQQPYYITQPYIAPNYPTWPIWSGGIGAGGGGQQTTTTAAYLVNNPGGYDS